VLGRRRRARADGRPTIRTKNERPGVPLIVVRRFIADNGMLAALPFAAGQTGARCAQKGSPPTTFICARRLIDTSRCARDSGAASRPFDDLTRPDPIRLDSTRAGSSERKRAAPSCREYAARRPPSLTNASGGCQASPARSPVARTQNHSGCYASGPALFMFGQIDGRRGSWGTQIEIELVAGRPAYCQ
jgi:hypothetical protein